MPITEQELEAAKELLRDEFKSKLNATLQELSVQITESHNKVVETAKDSFTETIQNAKEAINTHDEGLKEEVATLSREVAINIIEATATEHEEACKKALQHQLETIRQEIAPPTASVGDDGALMLRIEQHHLYLDDLADRLGQPRMEVN